MKRFIIVVCAFSFFMLGLLAANGAQKGVNFAGTWILDKAKSEGLQRAMQNAESVTWIVTQDEKQLSREQKAEGGQGGGRGLGMGSMTLKMDGSETTTDVPQFSGKRTSKAKWLDGEKILEVSTVTTGNAQGNDFKFTSTEHWELAEGGKVLKVHRKSDSPQGPTESKMVFNKK
ncbi:MAG: hypothetical protein L0220_17615 [Acidobacteria bacterium]|nr:hypothetical protein [Acidobacteriota bacterium]